MKKYLSLLKYEFKNILKDRMNAFMLFYPLVMLLMAVYLFPIFFENPEFQNQSLEITMLIIVVMLLGFGYVIAGALLGFSLLDSKDEDTLQTIAVTPIGKRGYINFKLIYVYILSLIGTIVLLSGIKIFAVDAYALQVGETTIRLFDNISHFEILVFALSSSLLAPVLGLFIAGLSKNKIEGFAYMKSTGIIMLIPMLVLLDAFKGMGQYLLSIFPNFWGTQGVLLKLLPNFPMLSTSYNLGFYAYILIGALISFVFLVLSYRFFIKRSITK